MKIKEMQEYLKKYKPEEDMVFMVVNTHERKVLQPFQLFCVTDLGKPVIGIDVNQERDMDQDEIEQLMQEEGEKGK